MVDAGEQAGAGSFGGFVVEQGVDGGSDSGGRLVAVEVPEVTQRPPHGGGAQHLDDGGEVARGSGIELGTGGGDDCHGGSAAVFDAGEACVPAFGR